MESVDLYTTHCPKCNVLETKLKMKGVVYNIVEGEDKILKLGFSSAPILRVNDKFMEFSEAITWINSKEVK